MNLLTSRGFSRENIATQMRLLREVAIGTGTSQIIHVLTSGLTLTN